MRPFLAARRSCRLCARGEHESAPAKTVRNGRLPRAPPRSRLLPRTTCPPGRGGNKDFHSSRRPSRRPYRARPRLRGANRHVLRSRADTARTSGVARCRGNDPRRRCDGGVVKGRPAPQPGASASGRARWRTSLTLVSPKGLILLLKLSPLGMRAWARYGALGRNPPDTASTAPGTRLAQTDAVSVACRTCRLDASGPERRQSRPTDEPRARVANPVAAPQPTTRP